jgi:hypothetical protein
MTWPLARKNHPKTEATNSLRARKRLGLRSEWPAFFRQGRIQERKCVRRLDYASPFSALLLCDL